jgi:hypothetical protein
MKAVFVILIFFCSFTASADILSMTAKCEVGYVPVDMFMNIFNQDIMNSYYTDFSARIFLFDFVFAGGGMRCHFTQRDLSRANFTPYTMDYSFEAGIKIEGFSIGFRHNCFHPTLCNSVQGSSVNAAYEEIYIRFEGKITLIK